jgi:diamine N-acetyltransferase
MTISLQPITMNNWKVCANLTVHNNQQGFVPGNLYSIAEAQFYPEACPLAIYNEASQFDG